MSGSRLVWCLDRNIPLAHYDRYEGAAGVREMGINSGKEIETAARCLVNGLSQYKVAEQMAREWEEYPALLRMRITDIANRTGDHSGNVRKGIAYLDDLLRGRVLRARVVTEERVLLERDGKLGVAMRRERGSAVIGAERAFAAYSLPKDYHTWSPAKKKRYREELARSRREQ